MWGLAYWIFYTIYVLCNRFDSIVKIIGIIKKLDKKSFAVYIVHYEFLAGRISLQKATGNIWLNTCLFVVLTVICAGALDFIADRVFGIIKNKRMI